MNRKTFIYAFFVFIPLIICAMPKSGAEKNRQLKEKINQIPDSLFENVKQEDLLVDEVYVKLAHDGWSTDEIKAIMNDYVKKNRKNVRGSLEYGRYAKQWLPSYGYIPGGDTLYRYVDTTYTEAMMRSVRNFMGTADDEYFKAAPYTPENRLKGQRAPGIFRASIPNPSSGRIHWIHVHPENADSILVIPDGGGINRTHDGGKTWDCITDRIPVREHRNTAIHSAIPVDPDDWNHVFAFMSNGNPVYETRNGGETWRRIEGATHKGFKRGYCFRDKAGSLKFIGAVQNTGSNYWASTLWISEDTCKTWTQVIVPDELKDIRPENGVKGNWFQQVEFDPSNRDMIYLPTSRSLFYFDDGAKSYTENGRTVYRIKKMNLRVYAEDGTTLRSDTTVFPYQGVTQSFLNINPNNPDQMWFATASRNVSYGDHTALYHTTDKGRTWKTLHEPYSGIGSGRLFGNESPWGWLGGFGVNYNNTDWVYGCSMSSAISNDGGHTFKEFGWGNRLKSLQEDGLYYPVSNSRHNADNHCIVSHKSGRVFRGSDGGLLMKDPNINNHDWTNIGNNMGQMLFYCVKVNEFGDQLIMGNTQDIDAQTYRYGRWGTWRGYEGTNGFVNPYSNTCYFSGGGGGGIDNMDFGSWNKGWSKADVCTGNWYLRREKSPSFYRIEDFGSTPVNLIGNIGEEIKGFALSRDKGRCTIFVVTNSNKLKRSTDNGNTFELIRTFTSGTAIVADPDDSNILYLGQQGKVIRYDVRQNKEEDISFNLPNVTCNDLFLHEGSGDLYFVHTGSGIYLKEKGVSTWRLWMKGYNPAKFGSAELNYTTQEMVIQDYGRGVYVADLQNPTDRFFKNGFALKEFSHKGGRRTIGIDTQWTIPLYYHYEWKVNGVAVDNPYRFLVAKLKKGDRVSLKLTLRESPDVYTFSSEFTVAETIDEAEPVISGNALHSDGSGRVDLGYVDYFFNDFTVELWMNPQGNGVILGNRQLLNDKGAKGWYLAVDQGSLRFKYAPANLFNQPTYEKAITQQTELNAGSVKPGQWMHVAVSHQRNGKVAVYVNGVKKVEADRILPEHTLNNAMYLSLFADTYEHSAIAAGVDELKIWNYALSEKEVRQTMYSHSSDNKDGLVYYNGFNQEALPANAEVFSGVQPQVRVRAKVEAILQPVPVCAAYAMCAPLDGRTQFADGDFGILTITPEDQSNRPVLGVYGYTRDVLGTPGGQASNLDASYYEAAPVSYQIRLFEAGGSANDTVDLTFRREGLDPTRKYSLYSSELATEAGYWKKLVSVRYNESDAVFEATGLRLSDLSGKQLILVTPKPAIEVSVPGMTGAGELMLFSPDKTTFAIAAEVVGRMEEPFTAYELVSENPFLKPAGRFSFMNGKAQTELNVIIDSLGGFGTSRQTVLKGKDDKMIPFPVRVVNRITPAESGSSVLIEKGGFITGNADLYADANPTNTVTLMGWVRIDSASVLSGLRPLIFFRGSGVAMGIHLTNGNMRCHWNEESWSWNTATTLTVTQQDLGRWMHLALVVHPAGVDYYMNGAKHSLKRNVNKSRILSGLMLGQNFSGDTWFSGAFDQVGMWNRSLSQEEVIRYMQTSVSLNDPALMVYQNMDFADESGKLSEPKTGASTTYVGKVTAGHRSPAPFNPWDIQKINGEEQNMPVTLLLPEGFATGYYLNTYKGHPYNYVNAVRSADIPLNKEYYTLIYQSKTAFSVSDTITVHINSPAIMANDSLSLGIRALGSESVFRNFVSCKAGENGRVAFRVQASLLSDASELMVMVSPKSGKRPVKAELTLEMPLVGDNRLILKDEVSAIPVQIRMLSHNPDDIVLLSVKETAYASVERDTVDFRPEGDLIRISIDRAKLNKLGYTPLTIQLSGAQAEPLELQLALEPRVVLRLKNGTDAHHFVAKTPLATLEVEAELIQGVQEEEVRLQAVTDIVCSMNTGSGTLLTDRTVKIDGLEYFKSGFGAPEEGWNLIGNPFLTDINLTKKQNVLFDAESVSRFLYQYNPTTENYEVADMTHFDMTHQIRPFGSYFVQTMAENAEISITPTAKEQSFNRRTLDYYNASERMHIRLQLFAGEQLADRTEILLESDAHPDFVVSEDASKLWSLNETVNQLYSKVGSYAVAVNTLPVASVDVPLEMKVGTPGNFVFRTDRITGFEKGDRITLRDKQTGAAWTLDAESEYAFEETRTGTIRDRFELQVNRVITNLDEVITYPVIVDGNNCIVRNLQGNALISVYDFQGRRFVYETVQTEVYQMRLAGGPYLVKIEENGKEYVTKIIVR